MSAKAVGVSFSKWVLIGCATLSSAGTVAVPSFKAEMGGFEQLARELFAGSEEARKPAPEPWDYAARDIMDALPEAVRQGEPSQGRADNGEAHARAEALGLGSVKLARRIMMGSFDAEWADAVNQTLDPKGASAERLLWPVESGHYVRGFGTGTGHHHLATDISAETGTPVKAAASGIVAYAGDELRGLGKVVIVMHQGEWATLYAHSHRLHVSAGEKVAQGDMLAEVGSTGISRGPHLHFELMHAGQHCNAAELFAARDGDDALGEALRRDSHIRLRSRVRHYGEHKVRCKRRKPHPNSRYLAEKHSKPRHSAV